MNNSQLLNKGYDDGFYGRSKPRFPNNESYMSGYVIGRSDRKGRIRHNRACCHRKLR